MEGTLGDAPLDRDESSTDSDFVKDKEQLLAQKGESEEGPPVIDNVDDKQGSSVKRARRKKKGTPKQKEPIPKQNENPPNQLDVMSFVKADGKAVRKDVMRSEYSLSSLPADEAALDLALIKSGVESVARRTKAKAKAKETCKKQGSASQGVQVDAVAIDEMAEKDGEIPESSSIFFSGPTETHGIPIRKRRRMLDAEKQGLEQAGKNHEEVPNAAATRRRWKHQIAEEPIKIRGEEDDEIQKNSPTVAAPKRRQR